MTVWEKFEELVENVEEGRFVRLPDNEEAGPTLCDGGITYGRCHCPSTLAECFVIGGAMINMSLLSDAHIMMRTMRVFPRTSESG